MPGFKPRRRGSQDPVWEMPVSAWLGWGSRHLQVRSEVELVEILLGGPAMPTSLSGSQAVRGGGLLSDLMVCEGLRPSLTVMRGVP